MHKAQSLAISSSPMARLLRRLAKTTPLSSPSSILKTLNPTQTLKASSSPSLLGITSRSFLSTLESIPAAFDENLLRILRSEIAYYSDHKPPYKPKSHFKLYTIQDHPGQQWIRLKSTYYNPGEEIKIDATLFDGVAKPNPNQSLFKKIEALERGPRLHISLVVEVSRAESAFGFICSAWPDYMVVENTFPLRQNAPSGKPYLGRKFKHLEEEMKAPIREYLVKRGVDDDMAVFLHDYMMNKDKIELIRWLKNIESYVTK